MILLGAALIVAYRVSVAFRAGPSLVSRNPVSRGTNSQ